MKPSTIASGFSRQQKAELQAALKIARQHHFEPKNARQATHLALERFDDLNGFNRQGDRGRLTSYARRCCMMSAFIRKAAAPIIKLL